MARAKVKLIGKGMSALLNDSGVVEDLEQRMERVLETAQTNAPVESGAYRDSLQVQTIRHPSRTVVRLYSDVPHAMVVEASTGNMARALDSAGGQ